MEGRKDGGVEKEEIKGRQENARCLELGQRRWLQGSVVIGRKILREALSWVLVGFQRGLARACHIGCIISRSYSDSLCYPSVARSLSATWRAVPHVII